MSKLILALAAFYLVITFGNRTITWINTPLQTAKPGNHFSYNEKETREKTQKFLTQVTLYGIKEASVKQVAAQKIKNPLVKKFTEKMTYNEAGVQAAARLFAQQVQFHSEETGSEITNPSTQSFHIPSRKNPDKVILDSLIDNHKKAIALLMSAIDENINPDVKIIINQTLPRLQSHLHTAESVREELQ